MRKFKKGDVYMVVDNIYRHHFKINQLVVFECTIDLNKNIHICYDTRGNDNDYWYLKSKELYCIGKL